MARRCQDCVHWRDEVFLGTGENGGACWSGTCQVAVPRGPIVNGQATEHHRHHSLFVACARLVEKDGRPSRFPLVGPRVPDGCEWNPETFSPARVGDRHHASVRAELVVGAKGEWRLCAACAAEPPFTRFRKRRPVRRMEVVHGS